MFVSCVQRRVVEGSVVGSRGCVVHVDMHGELVMLSVAAMELLYCTWHRGSILPVCRGLHGTLYVLITLL